MKTIATILLAIAITPLAYSQKIYIHTHSSGIDSMFVSQIDSITFTSQAPVITLTGRYISGLAFDAGFLWVVHQPTIFNNTFRISKISPSNGQVVIASGDISDNGRGITFGFGALWVTEATADVVSKIDPSNFNQITSFSTPGTEPAGIAFDGSNLWLTDPFFQHIYKIDTSGSIITSFSILNQFREGLEWDNGGMWTNTDSTTISYYTTSGTVTSTKNFTGLPSGTQMRDIAIGNGRIYIAARDKIFVQTWP